MIDLALDAVNVRQGRRGPATFGASRRNLRNRLIPGAEFLEVRDCPSALGAELGPERPAHPLVAGPRDTSQARPIHQNQHLTSHHDHGPLKKAAKGGPLTIYVAPQGKMGASAGKSPSRPLGSLAVALKRAKSGATIILAPGVYNQNSAVSNKSNITIIGAPNQPSILAPPSGQALKVYSSSNITIQNVWFRSAGTNGIGLAVVGSTVNVSNIQTAGTSGNGVQLGQGGVLNAVSSHFDQVQTGSGLELQPGSSATITGCTFNRNGTGANVTTSSNGLRVDTGATAKVVGSHFDGNTNAGLTAYGNAQVTASGSTFSGNIKSDGAIFLGQASVTLTGNTFASNGQIHDIVKGFNGLEFLGGPGNPDNYTGTAVVTGNSFVNNTAMGIYVGSAGHLTVAENQFSGNVVGIFLDGTGASINATVVGNTIEVDPNSIAPSGWQGIVASETGVTATIGGSGGDSNTLVNYPDGAFIYEATGQRGDAHFGPPNLTIGTNKYLRNGQPVDQSAAIHGV
jgi:parallel beta-helix repeat protein